MNFSETGILQDLPEFLPNKHVVVEVLETVKPSIEVFEVYIA